MTPGLEGRFGRLALETIRRGLAQSRRGIEKESLRVTPQGYIAHTDHPVALGSALENRFITTDYSEALLEFVTPPVTQSWEVIQFLCDIHQFVYERLDNELLWAMSMPCMIRSEADIPLARYGSSNVGTMKTVYRRGLGYRYGRHMQAIAGVHFNFSIADAFWPAFREAEKSTASPDEFRSAAYLGLIRNVRRLDWLLLYLFGASPAVCKTFFTGTETNLDELDRGTLYGPYATSLRMSDIGYHNSNQASLDVSANRLDEYIRDLEHAVATPNPEYARIGVVVDGVWRQLSSNHLQIENEYYSTVRPKRVALSGERPTEALRRGGIEYIELRALDISPFDPVGINRSHILFLDVFLMYCLLADSPPIDAAEQADNKRNQALAASRGRQPGLELRRAGQPVTLQQWGQDVCRDIRAIARELEPDGGAYTEAIDAQLAAVDDPEQTPSARLIAELRQTGLPVFQYAMQISRDYSDYFRSLPADMNALHLLLADESRESLERQAAVEAADDISFGTYLERYFAGL